MNKLNIVNEGSGRFIVDGDLTFATIGKNTAKIFSTLPQGGSVTMDLGGVGNADSAGLALLLEWVKMARANKAQLQFRNIPNQIVNLAKLGGIDQLGYFVGGPPSSVLQYGAGRIGVR